MVVILITGPKFAGKQKVAKFLEQKGFTHLNFGSFKSHCLGSVSSEELSRQTDTDVSTEVDKPDAVDDSFRLSPTLKPDESKVCSTFIRLKWPHKSEKKHIVSSQTH